MYSLFAVAGIIGVLTAFQILTAATGHPVIMVVVGDSMLPALKPYDAVYLEDVEKNSISVGDIVAIDYSNYILFESHNYFVHRVIKVWEADGKPFIQTKGDNNKIPEHAIAAEKVLGKVFTSVPYLGLVIGTPGNFMIIAGALLSAVYLRRKL